MRAGLLIALVLIAAWPSRGEAALGSCTVTATPVAFGTHAPLSGSSTDSTGTLTVTCSLLLGLSLAVDYTIQLSKGGSTTYAPRRMTSAGHTLNYNLYTTSARSAVWGDGTGGTSTIQDGYLLGLFGGTRNYTVYGRIPSGQTSAWPGVYADTITVTVDY